jgi:hypothetical protein
MIFLENIINFDSFSRVVNIYQTIHLNIKARMCDVISSICDTANVRPPRAYVGVAAVVNVNTTSDKQIIIFAKYFLLKFVIFISCDFQNRKKCDRYYLVYFAVKFILNKLENETVTFAADRTSQRGIPNM